MKLFTPNINGKGRLVRALLSVGLFGAAAFAYKSSVPTAIFLAIFGLFTAFEAIRGWCGLRACGIKTKI